MSEMKVARQALILSYKYVDEIDKSDIELGAKIIKLWAVTMIDARGPVGEEAANRLRALIGNETTIALMQITGFCLGGPDLAGFLRMLDYERFGPKMEGWDVRKT